jgi:hypothetical protein
LINHLAPYQFKNLITDKIKLDKYCKYITIKLKDIDSKIDNGFTEIKTSLNLIEQSITESNNRMDVMDAKIELIFEMLKTLLPKP